MEQSYKNNQLKIRNAVEEDFDRICEIYEYARHFMRDHGNPRQWNTAWPPVDLIREDISLHRNYVCTLNGEIVAVFVYLQGVDVDPTYLHIVDGHWIDASEYGVIHRIACDRPRLGIASFCIQWAFEKCHHLRIDTHGDNTVMRSLLEKLGFVHCGTIYVVEDNDPRFAFEKV